MRWENTVNAELRDIFPEENCLHNILQGLSDQCQCQDHPPLFAMRGGGVVDRFSLTGFAT